MFPILCFLVANASFLRHWRREAVSVLLGGMWVALRPFWWADSPFQETHRCKAFPVWCVQPVFLPLRSPGLTHEETPELETAESSLFSFLKRGLRRQTNQLKAVGYSTHSSVEIVLAVQCKIKIKGYHCLVLFPRVCSHVGGRLQKVSKPFPSFDPHKIFNLMPLFLSKAFIIQITSKKKKSHIICAFI